MTDDNAAYLVFESSVSEGEAHFESAPSRIELHKQIMLFGRGSPKNPVDVCIKIRKDDKEIISRNHAEISRTFQGQYILRDLDSMNGTFVNGRRIERHVLSESDIVQFGGESKVPINSMLKSNDTCIRYKFTLERRKRKRASNGGGDSLASSTNMKSPSPSLEMKERRNRDQNNISSSSSRKNNKISIQQPGQHLLNHDMRRVETEGEAEWIDEDELNELRRRTGGGGRNEKIKIKNEKRYQQSRNNNSKRSKSRQIQVTRDNDDMGFEYDDDQLHTTTHTHSHAHAHADTNDRYHDDDYEDYVDNKHGKYKYDHDEVDEAEAHALDYEQEEIDVEVATATLVRAIQKEGGHIDQAAVLNMLEQMNFRGSQSTSNGNGSRQQSSSLSKKDISLNSLANLPLPPDSDSKVSSVTKSSKYRDLGDRKKIRPRSPRLGNNVNNLATFVSKDKEKEKVIDTESMQSLTFSSTTNSNGSNGQNSNANSITSPTLSIVRPNLDLETVESHLCCPLCSDLLLDACVAKCSHGFCQHCLEKYIQNGNKTCPVCDDKASIFHRKYIDETVYFRSAHIDNLVWLMLESSETSIVEKFKLREIASRNFMDAIWSIWAADKQKQKELMIASTATAAKMEGVDVVLGKRSRHERDQYNNNNTAAVDTTPVQAAKNDAINNNGEVNDDMNVEENHNDYQEKSEEETEEMQRLDAESRAQRVAEMQQLEKEISELEAKTGGIDPNSGITEGKKEVADDEEEGEEDNGERCDYCAEGGHVEEQCPHKDRPNSESESSSSDDDDDDDKEGEGDDDDTVLGDGDEDEDNFFPRTQLE